jgi:hypothetical protein
MSVLARRIYPGVQDAQAFARFKLEIALMFGADR